MNNISAEKIEEFNGHTAAVYCLEQGPEPHLFFSGGSDMHLVLWSIYQSEAVKAVAKLPGIIYSICYIKEKNWLIAGESKGGIHVLDLTTNKSIRFIKHHEEAIFDIKYSFLNNQIYACSGDGSLTVWSLEDFSLLHEFSLCTLKARCIEVNKEETKVAVGCGDSSFRIYNIPDFSEEIKVYAHQHSIYSLKFHPNDKYFLSGARDAYLNIYSTEKDIELLRSIAAHNYAIYSIAFHPSGKYFATASRDKTVKIWDASTYEILLRINKEKQDSHSHSVNKLLWTDCNNYLISAGDDRKIFCWKIKGLTE